MNDQSNDQPTEQVGIDQLATQVSNEIHFHVDQIRDILEKQPEEVKDLITVIAIVGNVSRVNERSVQMRTHGLVFGKDFPMRCMLDDIATKNPDFGRLIERISIKNIANQIFGNLKCDCPDCQEDSDAETGTDSDDKQEGKQE